MLHYTHTVFLLQLSVPKKKKQGCNAAGDTDKETQRVGTREKREVKVLDFTPH